MFTLPYYMYKLHAQWPPQKYPIALLRPMLQPLQDPKDTSGDLQLAGQDYDIRFAPNISYCCSKTF